MDFNLQNIDDSQLWEVFRKGSSEAFGELYRRYAPMLYKYGVQITPDREIIHDAIQDFYTELWRKKAHLFPHAIKNYFIVGFRRALMAKLKGNSRRISQSGNRNTKGPAHEWIYSCEEELINGEITEARQNLLQIPL